MKLETAHFDAYRSLLNEKLELSDNCIGLVGINESGKTNVLLALGALSVTNGLAASDSPKMSRRTPPHLRFDFLLSKDEVAQVQKVLEEWCQHTGIDISTLTRGLKRVTYHVSYDRESENEARYFTFDSLPLPKDTYVLRSDATTEGYRVTNGSEMVDLENAILLSKSAFKANEKLVDASKNSMAIYEQESVLDSEVSVLLKELKTIEVSQAESDVQDDDDATDEAGTLASKEPSTTTHRPIQQVQQELEQKRSKLSALSKKRVEIEESLIGFDIFDLIADAEEKLSSINDTRPQLERALESAEAEVAELEELASPTESQTQTLATKKKSVTTQKRKLRTLGDEARALERKLDSLREPLIDKYTDEAEELSERIGKILSGVLHNMLPRVVHWTYSDEYILKGQIPFDGMLSAESLSQIPRPLVNLLRIGLGINDLGELKQTIRDVQADPSERNRLGNRLNREVNKYLKAVWKQYDQEINFTLEQDQICIQFFDPKCDDPSFYNMQERSQGCQTFISFLLTVGAEAKQGVISNTVLLLDEPETHLHPSGVRYMLAELKNAASNGNVVVFATHSVFMIDKDKYERHAIVRKKDELTSIELSRKDRLGFFMQEEVLYGALDVDLTNDFASRQQFNIVLEGDGDAALFRHFYDKVLNQSSRPYQLNRTTFYHGGKCSDMRRYFGKKPMRLGTTWVFLLDSDKPANDLAEFLKDQYGAYVGTCIHVFQYSRDDLAGKDVELEDLLPSELIAGVLDESAEQCEVSIDMKLPQENTSFGEYFSDTLGAISDSEADKKQFKKTVKKNLNLAIHNGLKKIKTPEQMANAFPVYNKWALNVIAELMGNPEASEQATETARSVQLSPELATAEPSDLG